MHQTEQDFNKDNGYKSRKFIVAILSIILLCIMALIYSIAGLSITIFETLSSSVVAIALGYITVNAARAAAPRYSQNKNTTPIKTEQAKLEQHSGHKEEL